MPHADAAPDQELLRLLDAYGTAFYESAIMHLAGLPDAHTHPDAARTALLAYLAAHYVRRDRPYDDGPWEPGDGSADGAALEREQD